MNIIKLARLFITFTHRSDTAVYYFTFQEKGNTQNMLQHVIFVTLEIYEKIENEGLPGDRTMGHYCRVKVSQADLG